MKFKLEFTFDISDSSLLIDANDGRSEEYTSLEDVPEDTLMDVVYNYLSRLDIVQVEECISVRCWPRGKKVWKRQLNCITI